jgi:hypothetical protein
MDRRQNHIPLFELEELEIRRAQLSQALKRVGLTVLGLAGAGALLWLTASPHHAIVEGKLTQAVPAVSNFLTEQAKSLDPTSVAHQVSDLFAPAPPPEDLSQAHLSDTAIPVPSASEAEALPPTPPAPPAPQPQNIYSASADRLLPQVLASSGESKLERFASGNFPETIARPSSPQPAPAQPVQSHAPVSQAQTSYSPMADKLLPQVIGQSREPQFARFTTGTFPETLELPHARPNASKSAEVNSKKVSKPRVSAPVIRERVEDVKEPDEPVESPCARGALESCGYARSPIFSNAITKVYTVDPRTREEKLTGIYTSPPDEVGR